jgi:cytochrome b
MVFALLIGLSATVLSGLELYAAKENAGPLAFSSGEAGQAAGQNDPLLMNVSEGEENERGESSNDEGVGETWKELHEFLANVMLTLVTLHITGVLFASVVHRENLIQTMVTGRKRAQ